ncbi:histidine phosphatase family protein [Propionivibrio sp.]|uniref:SixA phosphatase family protein n=1 Tax=Propionivibrio sp. TaxID=2212460 RepID=UPI0025CDDF1A|nr:histidine phosphatase family protein [Propionivibrio sp.]MBK7357311.1 histidine phosphatase family protein [Propionivibrio sp.]MBK8401285.1 histidine phosphatase family protein [Propionivibrio sp.]MBK8743159.1 histidine phosphatase family protein [Propionivibrio sp.]MBK8894836.1 histidine phosphatase family protein [Propionivibrio sp.]MBL0209256.1 histidine phosphatase family protein [Propionivibrio sp.]
MELLLWRHAEAAEGTPDLKRKLTARGERQARHMAEWLALHAPKKLRILASPALRCQQTAQALGRPFTTDKRLNCEGNASNLLAVIGWPEGSAAMAGSEAVLVVGHQPTLGQMAALLLSGAEADWVIKKGAVWWLSNRTRLNEMQTVLRAVIPPEFVG